MEANKPSNEYEEIKKLLELYKAEEKKHPNFKDEYTLYKKILEIYIKKTDKPLHNLRAILDFYIKTQQELHSIYQELYELIHILNPKLLDFSNQNLQENNKELKKLLDILQATSSGLKEYKE